MKRVAWMLAFLITAPTVFAEGTAAKETAMKFNLKSPQISEGKRIPAAYTCDGTDLSPELIWPGAPPGTQEFALICEDPDAPMGSWVHWVLYKIPASRSDLPEGLAKEERTKGMGVQGKNDFGKTGYNGPCPPPGQDHRYIFKVYALSKPLNLAPGATKEVLLSAMKGLVLGEGSLMGVYSR